MTRSFFFLLALFGTISGYAGRVRNNPGDFANAKTHQVPADSLLDPVTMRSDFSYLRGKLEQTHPGLYKHQGRERMQLILDSLSATLNRPLPFLEFYSKVAFIMASIGCEHSYANIGDRFDSYLKTWKMLPFQLHFAGRKPIVVVNGTTDERIHPGDEVISINGRPIDSIIRILRQYIPSDGFMVPSRDQALSSMLFAILYNQYIEQPLTYDLVVKDESGKLITGHYSDGLDFASVNKRAVKNKVNRPVLEADKRGRAMRKKELNLVFDEAHHSAIMTVRSFSLGKDYFKKTIDGFFRQVADKQSPDLIIDLSYNGGGEEELAAYLMSYLVDTTTRFMLREYLIDTSDANFALSNVPDEVKANKYAFIDSMKDGISLAKITGYSQELVPMEPRPSGFHGKVWLYVNGMTSSAASTFAAVAQSNHRATIIGQETAGSFIGGGTVLGLDLTLPGSSIKVHSSIVYQEFATHGRDGNRGVIPDHDYVPGYEEMIGNNSEWKELIFSLMNK